ncbi:unnamed protein product [Scytosiphon promiscuus]
MSAKKGSTPLEQAYYAGSYQQGSNSAVVADGPAATPTSDRAYAQRLQEQEGLPTATGRPVRAGAAGTQYVAAIYPPSTPFDPADLGVAGGFVSPHEAKLLEAFSLGKTIRLLALVDGLLLLANCAYYPGLLLLLFWGPISGWMAGSRYSTAWTYAYCCYYLMRLSTYITYILEGYLWFVLVFASYLVIARFILKFAKILVSLSPAEIEQLCEPSAARPMQYRRQPQDQPFQEL